MQLVVAEKPSVARDLARLLGVAPRGEHCFEGERHVITWCIGHLVELDEPASYDARWRAWRLENLPMLPEEFRLRGAKHARAQLRAVASLLRDRRRFRSVINACDAGREGELIFRYVYQYANAALPIERLWVSSLTDEAIRRGFASLRPGRLLEPLADAARSRSEADWLVGMNATRAITARGRDAGHDALYSIGRVQTPTLAMLVARERVIRTFVPTPYWEVRGDFTTADGARFPASWRANVTDTRLATAALASTLVARDRAAVAASPAVVERTRARTTREPPPLLFDLTSLQRTANRRFGFSAARTLELAQALYERHKVLTYPRTDSRHLSSDVVGELPNLFASLASIPDYAVFAQPLVANPPRAPSRRIVDDAKVGDHHAIIPTSRPARPQSLDRDEARIYDLVVRRFLGVFYPDAEFAITEAWIKVGAAPAPPPKFADELPRPTAASTANAGASSAVPPAAANAESRDPILLDALPPPPDRFLARGRVRTVAGWQEVAGIGADAASSASASASSERDEPLGLLPALKEGDVLPAAAFTALAKQTTPPPRYTEATLLGAMESAGRSIDDEALRAAMKDRGLGTPATRASIIETLLRRAYIVRDRQQLVPTPMGVALIEALPVASLASPELTGAWEARLAQIARGEDSRAKFMADIARYVAEMVDAIRGAAPPAAPPPGAAQPQQQASWGGKGGGKGGRKGRGGRGTRPTGGAGGSNGHSRSNARSRDTDRGSSNPIASADRSRDTDRGASNPIASADRSRDTDRGASNRIASADRSRDTDRGASNPIASADRSRDTDRGASNPNASADRSRGTDRPSTTIGSADRSRGTDRPSTTSGSADRSRGTGPATTSASADRSRGSDRPSNPNVSPDRGTEAASLGCPSCRQASLMAGARGWGCSRWREGCRFVIWFETAGRRITPSQLRDLVTRGKTRKATFEPVRGMPQAGRLVLDTAASTRGSPMGAARFEPSNATG